MCPGGMLTGDARLGHTVGAQYCWINPREQLSERVRLIQCFTEEQKTVIASMSPYEVLRRLKLHCGRQFIHLRNRWRLGTNRLGLQRNWCGPAFLNAGCDKDEGVRCFGAHPCRQTRTTCAPRVVIFKIGVTSLPTLE